MGSCMSHVVPPPVLSEKVHSASEIIEQITNHIGHDAVLFIWDAEYQTIEKSEIEKFLMFNINQKYILQRYDCDNFAISLSARVHEWCHDANGSSAVAFGIMTGNLKLKPDDPDRYHAVNFFLDSKNKMWIIDPMYNHVFEIPKSFIVRQIII